MLVVGWLRHTTEILWWEAMGRHIGITDYKPSDLTDWTAKIGLRGLSEGICAGRIQAVGSWAGMIRQLAKVGAVW